MPDANDRLTYRDIKADIMARIQNRRWGPDQVLPAEVELAASYGCARATVNRALTELTDEGILERRRKAGTRVRAAPLRAARFEIPIVRRQIEEAGAVYDYRLISRAECRADAEPRLGGVFAAGEPLLHLHCLHLADDRPFQFENRFISLAALPQARDAAFDHLGPNEWLVSAVPYSEVEVSFLALGAEAPVTTQLGVEPGQALFCMERTTWWEGRTLTNVRLFHLPGYRMTTRY